MKRIASLLIGILPVLCLAQRVQLHVGESLVEIQPQQTQTEITPGWKIVDIQLKNKTQRYLPGRESHQQTDDGHPIFIITPGKNETLVDYALIRMRPHRQFRALLKPNLMDNSYTRLEPKDFNITTVGDDSFQVQPKEVLLKGEYILTNIKQTPIGELGDYIVFPFQTPKL